MIEVSSAAAVAWQFAGRDPEAREKIALRVIAFSFFGLAVFVTVDAVRSLRGGGEADHSTVGLVLAAVSLAVMPLLSYGQRRTGRELGSRSAVADSKQTLLCTYLSAVLLVGLALNSLFGWSWADPIAALVIAAVAVREGRWPGAATAAAARLPPFTPTPETSAAAVRRAAPTHVVRQSGGERFGEGEARLPKQDQTCSPDGIRTRATALRGRRARPLHNGALAV